MDFANGEILGMKLRLIASAARHGRADRALFYLEIQICPAISGALNLRRRRSAGASETRFRHWRNPL